MWLPFFFFFRGHPYIWRTTVRHDNHHKHAVIRTGMFLFKAHLYTNLHTHYREVSTAWMGEVPLAQEPSAPRVIAEQQASQIPHKDNLRIRVPWYSPNPLRY